MYLKNKWYYINWHWNFGHFKKLVLYGNCYSDVINFGDLLFLGKFINSFLILIFKSQPERSTISKSCPELSLMGDMGGAPSLTKPQESNRCK